MSDSFNTCPLYNNGKWTQALRAGTIFCLYKLTVLKLKLWRLTEIRNAVNLFLRSVLLHYYFLTMCSENPAGHTPLPDYKIDIFKQVNNILCDLVIS